jgi:hypothetical protein
MQTSKLLEIVAEAKAIRGTSKHRGKQIWNGIAAKLGRLPVVCKQRYLYVTRILEHNEKFVVGPYSAAEVRLVEDA